MGIEGAFDGEEEVVTAVAELEFEVVALGFADAVFAGDGAAEVDGELEDFSEGVFDPGHFDGVAFVGEDGGVEVAVAHVAEVGDAELVFFADGLDAFDHADEFAAGDGGVFEDGGGADAGEGAEGGAAGGGEFETLGFVGGAADGSGVVATGDGFHGGGFGFDHGGVAVAFHEEEGFGFDGEAHFGVGFDAAEGGVVEEFEGAGDDAGGDDVADGLGGVFDAVEGGDEGAAGFGGGDETEEDLGDDAKGAFAADEEVFEGVAGDVFDAFVAEPEHLAVGEDDLHAHDVVAGDAVFEATEAAGIFRDVATDGGDFHGAGVGGVEEAGGGGGGFDFLGDDATFGVEGEVAGVDFEDAVHADEAEDDAALDGEAAAGEAGAGAAGDEFASGGGGVFDYGDDLGGRFGEDDGGGFAFETGGAVEAVGEDVFVGGENAGGADGVAEALDKRGVMHGRGGGGESGGVRRGGGAGGFAAMGAGEAGGVLTGFGHGLADAVEVAAGGGGGAGGIAGFDGVEDSLVFEDEEGAVALLVFVAMEVVGDIVFEEVAGGAHEVGEGEVMRGVGDGEVEGEVGLGFGGGGDVVLGDEGAPGVEAGGEAAVVGGGGAGGGEAGGGDFEEGAVFEEVAGEFGGSAEFVGEEVAGAVDGVVFDEGAAALEATEAALGFEAFEGGAEGGAGDAELGGEEAFRGEAFAGAVEALGELAAEGFGDQVGDAGRGTAEGRHG